MLGLQGDLDPALPGVLPELPHPALPGRRRPTFGHALDVWERPHDQDLERVDLHVRGLGEPLLGQAAGEPAGHLLLVDRCLVLREPHAPTSFWADDYKVT